MAWTACVVRTFADVHQDNNRPVHPHRGGSSSVDGSSLGSLDVMASVHESFQFIPGHVGSAPVLVESERATDTVFLDVDFSG
jgi:hypothetical protein